MSSIAKLFMHGRSQAIRLPKEFRLTGREVKVSRVGDAVLLEPLQEGRPSDAAAFWVKIDTLPGGEFPEPTYDDLAPGLDEEPEFD